MKCTSQVRQVEWVEDHGDRRMIKEYHFYYYLYDAQCDVSLVLRWVELLNVLCDCLQDDDPLDVMVNNNQLYSSTRRRRWWAPPLPPPSTQYECGNIVLWPRNYGKASVHVSFRWNDNGRQQQRSIVVRDRWNWREERKTQKMDSKTELNSGKDQQQNETIRRSERG